MAKAIHIYVHDGKRTTKDASTSWQEVTRSQYAGLVIGKSYKFGSRIGKVLEKSESTSKNAAGIQSGGNPMVRVQWRDLKETDDAEMTRIERAITEDPEGQAKVAASKKMTEQQILKDLRAYGIDINAPHVKRYIDAFRKVMKGANK